jgi:hypothetical protein
VKIDMNGNAVDIKTGEHVPKFGDFDVITAYIVAGQFPFPLPATVKLPGVQPASFDFWPLARASDAPPIIDDIVHESEEQACNAESQVT